MLWGKMEVPCRHPCQGKHVWPRRAAASDPLPEQCLQQGPARQGQDPASPRRQEPTSERGRGVPVPGSRGEARGGPYISPECGRRSGEGKDRALEIQAASSQGSPPQPRTLTRGLRSSSPATCPVSVPPTTLRGAAEWGGTWPWTPAHPAAGAGGPSVPWVGSVCAAGRCLCVRTCSGLRLLEHLGCSPASQLGLLPRGGELQPLLEHGERSAPR